MKFSEKDKAIFNPYSETFNFDPLTNFQTVFYIKLLDFFFHPKILVPKSYTPPFTLFQFFVRPLSDFGFNLLMKSQHV